MRRLTSRLTCANVMATGAVFLAFAPSAVASTIDVATTGDTAGSGCNLRSAISAANADAAVGGCAAGSGADTIVLHSATYSLTREGWQEDANATGDLDITTAITITGDGSDKSIIKSDVIDRVLEVHSNAVVVLKNVTVTEGFGGFPPDSDPTTESNPSRGVSGRPANLGQDGGGILTSGNLTLDHVVVRDNLAGNGGNGGKATHTNAGSATGGNGGRGGRGGGVANFGTLQIIDSRIAGNRAGAGGNGASGTGGPGASASTNGSTAGAGGTGTGGNGGAGGDGGGIYTSFPITVVRSVIAGNRAGTGGIGGLGTGGNGGNMASSAAGNGGVGGTGNGGTGGHGGAGGGLAVNPAPGATSSISDSAVSGNFAGLAGTGTEGDGGRGGDGGGSVYDGTQLHFYYSGGGGSAVGGRGGYGGSGGGMAENNGIVNVARTTVAGNAAGNGVLGGGATPGATGTVQNGGLPWTTGAATGGAGGDGGSGGGIHTEGAGAKTLTDSTIDSNTTGSGGAGSAAVSGPAKTGGVGGGAGSGGGLDSHASPLTIVRATISANTIGTSGSGGAGAANGVSGVAGAIWGGASTRLTASILADNQAPRCYDTVDDGGGNIDFPADPACPGTSVDPLLKAMADNGGIGQTRALSPASPAIDAVACDAATDERGVPRPIGTKCDPGAYEFALPAIAGVSATAGDTSASVDAQVTPYDSSATVTFDWGADTSYGTTATKTIAGVATATGVTFPVDGLQAGTTYHYRLTANTQTGTATTGDLTFTTTGETTPGDGGGSGGDGGGGPIIPSGGGDNPITPVTPVTPRDTTDPEIKSVKADPSKFLVGPKKTPVRGRVRGAAKIPVGTKLKVTLSEDAGVEITFEHKEIGKKGKTKSGKKTCAESRKPPKHVSDRCTLYVEIGTLTRDGDKGANAIAFSGRVGSKALPVGLYRFTVAASDTAGNDADAVTGKFTILDPDDEGD